MRLTESPEVLTCYALPDVRDDVDPRLLGWLRPGEWNWVSDRRWRTGPTPTPVRATQSPRHCACKGRGGRAASPDD